MARVAQIVSKASRFCAQSGPPHELGASITFRSLRPQRRSRAGTPAANRVTLFGIDVSSNTGGSAGHGICSSISVGNWSVRNRSLAKTSICTVCHKSVGHGSVGNCFGCNTSVCAKLVCTERGSRQRKAGTAAGRASARLGREFTRGGEKAQRYEAGYGKSMDICGFVVGCNGGSGSRLVPD
jgi:hypothetical protein